MISYSFHLLLICFANILLTNICICVCAGYFLVCSFLVVCLVYFSVRIMPLLQNELDISSSHFCNSLCGIGSFFINVWQSSPVKAFRVGIERMGIVCACACVRVCVCVWSIATSSIQVRVTCFLLSGSHRYVFHEICLFYPGFLQLSTVFPYYHFSVCRVYTDAPSFILDVGDLYLSSQYTQ